MNIDLLYYQKHGGDVRKPMYLDTAPYGLYGKHGERVRVFVSAQWYRTWPEWKDAAAVAIDTALRGTNPIMVQRGITIGSAVELVDTPTFIFDHSKSFPGKKDLSILLNAAAIQDEKSFESTLVVAEARRRVLEKGIAKNPGKDEYTQYPPAENGVRYAWDSIKDTEAADRRNLSRLFSAPDPAEERREALIREFMALEMQEP